MLGLQKLYCDPCGQKTSHPFLRWASNWPIWTASDLTWLFRCACRSYPTLGSLRVTSLGDPEQPLFLTLDRSTERATACSQLYSTRNKHFLLRNLYAGQEAVRIRHGTTDWFQTGKGVRQGCILSLCLFNLHVDYIMRNTTLDEAQPGIKIAGRNINNLRFADDTILMAESKERRASWWKWNRRVKKLA